MMMKELSCTVHAGLDMINYSNNKVYSSSIASLDGQITGTAVLDVSLIAV